MVVFNCIFQTSLCYKYNVPAPITFQLRVASQLDQRVRPASEGQAGRLGCHINIYTYMMFAIGMAAPPSHYGFGVCTFFVAHCHLLINIASNAVEVCKIDLFLVPSYSLLALGAFWSWSPQKMKNIYWRACAESQTSSDDPKRMYLST